MEGALSTLILEEQVVLEVEMEQGAQQQQDQHQQIQVLAEEVVVEL
jgi:hypothetical protein